MVLVDTDVLVDVARGFHPAISWLSSVPDEEIVMPGFVVMELIQGCRDLQEQRRMEKLIAHFDIEWPGKKACETAMKTFIKWHRSRGVGIIDCLIGHLAVDLGAPLPTFNRKHYSMIPGIRVSAPYARSVSRHGL